MNTEKETQWDKKYPKGKAPLSWDVDDYIFWEEEPPSCLITGITEGQAMSEDEITDWLSDEVQSLSIIREEYPARFTDQHNNFVLDLEYLVLLGKITKEEAKKLCDKGNFEFGNK